MGSQRYRTRGSGNTKVSGATKGTGGPGHIKDTRGTLSKGGTGSNGVTGVTGYQVGLPLLHCAIKKAPSNLFLCGKKS